MNPDWSSGAKPLSRRCLALASFRPARPLSINPNWSLDFGEIARLCHAACFWPGRRRSGLRRGVAGNRMRTEAGKMPGSLIFPIRNGHGLSNDRFGIKVAAGLHACGTESLGKPDMRQTVSGGLMMTSPVSRNAWRSASLICSVRRGNDCF